MSRLQGNENAQPPSSTIDAQKGTSSMTHIRPQRQAWKAKQVTVTTDNSAIVTQLEDHVTLPTSKAIIATTQLTNPMPTFKTIAAADNATIGTSVATSQTQHGTITTANKFSVLNDSIPITDLRRQCSQTQRLQQILWVMLERCSHNVRRHWALLRQCLLYNQATMHRDYVSNANDAACAEGKGNIGQCHCWT